MKSPRAALSFLALREGRAWKLLAADKAPLVMALVEALVRESEIDLRGLRANVRALLAEVSQASVGELLRRFPAPQGLGSVVGYVALGARHGEVTEAIETVCWQGRDGVARAARIPTIHFLRERLLELHD
ncbi:DUF3375 family protein [uncultured Azohydromonas sp.]|jgi:Protein of unknown function (DUF3375).|uniref:DUF3375 family protein n=1 Tax=uncultured Azohydromonas sp. TaxID=487342 RepID=UPI00260D7FE3|nr:DUF3375 family protein [uncultured Azohydromonas sp.]